MGLNLPRIITLPVLFSVFCLSLAVNIFGAAPLFAAAQKVYYEPTIKAIVLNKCARCHSGATRNLTEYDALQMYATSGLLRAMVSPGGPMGGFAGSDAQTIIDWVDQGALEKPGAAAVAFMRHNPPASHMPGLGPDPFPVTVPNNQINYNNTIKFIVAKDCLECHAGKFRNLTTYSTLKYYVDNGLLAALVQPGGQMHRFAGPDSKYIMAWISNGAPQ
jgi:hypothetical protein